MNANLQDKSDAGAMCGPTVTVTSGSDGMSVEVGHGFGVTALTADEWKQLEAKRGDKPYVLVETGGPKGVPFVSPLRTYADAMAEFNRDVTSGCFDYRPHTGRSLRVMTQADYLARRDGGEQW